MILPNGFAKAVEKFMGRAVVGVFSAASIAQPAAEGKTVRAGHTPKFSSPTGAQRRNAVYWEAE